MSQIAPIFLLLIGVIQGICGLHHARYTTYPVASPATARQNRRRIQELPSLERCAGGHFTASQIPNASPNDTKNADVPGATNKFCVNAILLPLDLPFAKQ
ncbi:MAG: hypothetical protein D6755_03560 [Anaerolineae bacterium]|nr:MAG: hypothetical protein D6755_03560 [Anaerolineae bacterium]